MPSNVKGISTYQTYLMYRTTTNGTYSKLIDITSFPDLVPPKDRIDITSLSDYMRVYINGIDFLDGNIHRLIHLIVP